MSAILEQLQSQIQSVKTSLNSGGVSTALQTELVANQMLLQGWVNKLISGRALTQDEINEMENALDSSKKKTLEAQAARTKRTVLFSGIGIIVIISGIIFYQYKMKKR